MLTQQQLKFANSESTLLITGETGTGKSILARKLHENSPTAAKRFVHLNIASINENLIESELFGHEQGSFSGANQKRIGRLEFAEQGTVFIDELGELPLHLQVKLLDFLNSKEINPVGSNIQKKLNVRVILATNKELKQMTKLGEFREDLFYRINTFEIKMQSLRFQKNLIQSLSNEFLTKFTDSSQRQPIVLKQHDWDLLLSYSWPGNIRELENAMEYFSSTFEFPTYIYDECSKTTFPVGEADNEGFSVNYKESKESFEKKFIYTMLKKFNGKINQTSRETKLSKVSLIEKIRKYSIDIEKIKFQLHYDQLSPS